MEDKKSHDSVRTFRDDKVSALKSYRKAKGLCFTCGECWSKDHKYAQTVQLHVVEELLEAFQYDEEDDTLVLVQDSALDENLLMAISAYACNGTDSAHSLRVKGLIQGTELLILIDSGSTHSFADEHIIHHLQAIEKLSQPVKVRVADGGILGCEKQVPNCAWWFQSRCYRSNFKLLPLTGYMMPYMQ